MSCPCQCAYGCPTPLKRGDGLFATIFKLCLLYVVVVFAAGTLVNTGNPVAVEVGRILHLATMIDPVIHWSQNHGWSEFAGVLQTIARGAPISALLKV